jgi:hypothetical protein
MHDQKQLHDIALDYPWFMFTGEEIAVLCNVSQNVISRVKALPDSPFFLNKCRPEWFLEWMRNHPEFQLTKAYSPLTTVLAEKPSIDLPPQQPTALANQITKAKRRSRRPSVPKL